MAYIFELQILKVFRLAASYLGFDMSRKILAYQPYLLI